MNKQIQCVNSSDDNDSSSSVIKLSLRKPREWNWSLTTSSSSPAILLPKIQLWDEEEGDLLLDTRYKTRSKTTEICAHIDNRKDSTMKQNGLSRSSSRLPVPKSYNWPNEVRIKTPDSNSVKGSQISGNTKSFSHSFKKDTPVICLNSNSTRLARKASLPKKIEQINSSDSSVTETRNFSRIPKLNNGPEKINSKPEIKNSASFASKDGRSVKIDGNKSIKNWKNTKKSKSQETTSKSASENNIKTPPQRKTDLKNKMAVPVLKLNSSRAIIDKFNSKSKEERIGNNMKKEISVFRKPKMELIVCDGPVKNRFNIRRLDEAGDSKPSLSQQSTVETKGAPVPVQSVLNRVERKVKESKVTKKNSNSEGDECYRSRVKKKVYKTRSQRRRHRNVSSSSSESELSRLPEKPRKKRRSQKKRGDRLLGINGQCVRHPEEAKDLLCLSGDVVSLQLSRHVIGSQSLPRNRVDSTHETQDDDMGSNVSRHSGKGLTGRRSQSSGNLCNGKMRPSVGRFFSPCSRTEVDNVGPRDRYKFCGSLPNHLDAKDPVLDEMSETDDDSSYRNNNNVSHQMKNKKNVELRLHPLVSKGTQHGHQDSVTNDQGYASERSPEDELPPAIVGTCPVHHKPVKQQYPIITKNSTFTVSLQKGTRGLGLSVTGGIETDELWPGLIRIKRLFPHQPAWQSGLLAQGDILIAANNTALTGLTNYEALEVLRTTPTEVVLRVCRLPPEIQLLNAPGSDSAPAPPKRDLHSTSGLLLPLKRQESFGEFQITLKKVNGSLGFTLRKEDESVLGHYVRALVKEPALSDGRIKPGDKIVAVNNVPMSPMSHEEAVMFLRQCDEEVHLKLFRDPVQTPILALSPTEAHRTFKPILRKEAQDMLSDLAVKKSLSPNDSTGSSSLSRLGRSSSPRKRRLTKTPSPDNQLNGSGPLSWSSEVLERIVPDNDTEKPSRPDSLNLYAKHKPFFQFASTVIVTEETELSSDELDSSSQNQIVEEAESPVGVGPLPSEPVSMPPILSSSSTGGFSYRNPAYRSANPSTTKAKGSMCEELPENRCSDNDLSGTASGEIEGSKSLLKWKGVLFSPEDRSNSINSPEDSISQITETEEGSSNQVLVIELMRGWNSRLGFSLQQVGPNTVISAIHLDSVASRDGRLKPGDQLVMVNDESVEKMSTSEVIDLLRRIRGVICITVWRKLKD